MAMTVVSATPPTPETTTVNSGVRIFRFLQGKNFFITGATGFVGKVFVEKLLRDVPDVGKLFLLIKAKDKEAAENRVKHEIMLSELFCRLRQTHGKSYESFMRSKLVPVLGDVSQSNLGMDADFAAQIAQEIHVIVNSAANTSFIGRYDVLLNTNTKGSCRLMSFAQKCSKLRVFLHVSTVFVNGRREGIIMEKPFLMGQSIAAEDVTSLQKPLPDLDIDVESELISDSLKSFDHNEISQKMKDLGAERARLYGWKNTYELTKAMGEMVMNSKRGNIPIVIIRPSSVEGTYREPFPGWIEGYKAQGPIILSYGKGQLPGVYGNPEAVVDIIPVDMLVNAIIAAIAKHGIAGKSGLEVYHVASSAVNPLSLNDALKFSLHHFSSFPIIDQSTGTKITVKEMKFFDTFESFSSYIQKASARFYGITDTNKSTDSEKQIINFNKKVKQLIHMIKVYDSHLVAPKRWFHNENMQKLLEELSDEEKQTFWFDVESINWKYYFLRIYIPGLRKHLLKDFVPTTNICSSL